jgi:hypothetical protein
MIFHGGDWEYDNPREKCNPLEHGKLDTVFLGIGAYLQLFGHKNGKMDESEKPENVILMHIPPNMDGLTEEEKKSLTSAIVFRSPMEIKVFS